MSFKLFSSIILIVIGISFISLSNGALITQSEYPPTVQAADISAQTTFTKYDWSKVIVNIYYRYPKATPAPPANATLAPTPAPITITNCTFFNETINGNETIISLHVDYSNGTSVDLSGQNTTISGCPGTETPYNVRSVVFFPKVDYFAALKVGFSYDNFTHWNDVKLSMEIGGISSSNVTYRDPTILGLFVPSYGIAASLSSGVVQSLAWDTIDCQLCNVSKTTTQRECYNGGSCVSDDAYDAHSDIYIYFAWVGTDFSGEPCQSTNYLPSQFAQFSIQPVFQAATSLATTSFDGSSP